MKNLSNIKLPLPKYRAIGVIILSLFILSPAKAARDVSDPKDTSFSDVVDRWQIHPDIGQGRGDPGVVVVNNKIHVISGFGVPGGNYRYSQEVYDPQTSTWEYIGAPPIPRSDFVALNFGDKIYAIGGFNFDLEGVLDLNHMYDPAMDTWDTMLQPLPIPVSGAGGVVLNDKIYILGGYDSNGMKLNDVQIYDPVSDTWSEGIPMNSVRSEFEAVVLNGLIYAVGGQQANSINDFEIYDPVSEVWTEGPELPERRANMAVAVRQGNIYVIGGVKFESQPNDVKDTMFIFDPVSNLWSTGASMPTARRACRAAVVSDKIYVIGGVGEPGAGTANEVYGPFPSPVYLPLVGN